MMQSANKNKLSVKKSHSSGDVGYEMNEPPSTPNKMQSKSGSLGSGPKTPHNAKSTTKKSAPKSTIKSSKVIAREAALTAMGGVKIDVFVRVRPQNEQEKTRGDLNIVTVDDDCKGLDFLATTGREHSFEFDRVFEPSATQEYVFDTAIQPIIDQVCSGLSCAIFAYGQTGAGKTHTMRGNLKNNKDHGVIQRSASSLLQKLRESNFNNITTTASFLEIYNEGLEDLLCDSTSKPKLMLLDDKKHGCVCKGLTQVPFTNDVTVMNLLASGEKRARVAETKMNKVSNRAHRIFILTMKYKTDDGEEETATLTFVDLAGSEDINRSGAKGSTAREACHINKSLLSLGRVIDALATNEKHIPYRDSKLTQLLSEALGGMCKTTFISCISPAVTSARESDKTLRYAARAMEALNISQLPRWKQDQIMIDGLTRRVEALLTQIEAIQLSHQQETKLLKEENATLKDNQSKLLDLLARFPKMMADALVKNASRQIFSCDDLSNKMQSDIEGLSEQIESHTVACTDNIKAVNTKIQVWEKKTKSTLAEIEGDNKWMSEQMTQHKSALNEYHSDLSNDVTTGQDSINQTQENFTREHSESIATVKDLINDRTHQETGMLDSCTAQTIGTLSSTVKHIESQEQNSNDVFTGIKKTRVSKYHDFTQRIEGIHGDIQNTSVETKAFVEKRLLRDTEEPPAKVQYKYPKAFPKTACYESIVGKANVEQWRKEVAISSKSLQPGLGPDFAGKRGNEDCTGSYQKTADQAPKPTDKQILDVANYTSGDEEYDTDEADENIASVLFPSDGVIVIPTHVEAVDVVESNAITDLVSAMAEIETFGGQDRDAHASALAVLSVHPMINQKECANLVKRPSSEDVTIKRRRSYTKLNTPISTPVNKPRVQSSRYGKDALSTPKMRRLESTESNSSSTSTPDVAKAASTPLRSGPGGSTLKRGSSKVDMKRVTGFPLQAIGRRVRTSHGHTAVIRFIGFHPETRKARLGVEFLTPLGNMDGTDNGFKFFSCRKNFGMLLKPDTVHLQA